jgi:MFS family permease
VDEDDGGDGDSPESLSEFLGASRTLFASSFLLVFLAVMLSGLYYRGILTFLPDLLTVPGFAAFGLTGVELDSSRYLYSGLLMVGVLGQYVGGKLTDRITPEYGLIGAYVVLTLLALAFVPASESALMLVAVSVVLGFFLFGVQPLHQATVARHSPSDVRGLSYGYTYLGIFGVGGLGAAIAGAALTYLSESGLFLVLAGISAVAVLVVVVLVQRYL